MNIHSSVQAGRQADVSIVIPTRHRPDLVRRAVASALAQDFANVEVLVVVDGDDPPARAALSAFSDPRLRILDLPANVGGSEARNVGVRAAQGEWIAFLDDDDEWLPHKLSRQIVVARRSTAAWPVISSRMIVETQSRRMLRPLRTYDPRKPISEFLFCRNSFRDGPFAMQTSTLMARREMLLSVPFRAGLQRHQDWDWLLRAQRMLGVEFTVVDEPLVIFRAQDLDGQDPRESVSRSLDWRFSLEWAGEMHAFFSAEAYSWFMACECASRAAKSRAGLRVYAEIVRGFLLRGRPSVRSTAMLVAFLALPRRWRQRASQRAKAKPSRTVPSTRNMPSTLEMEA